MIQMIFEWFWKWYTANWCSSNYPWFLVQAVDLWLSSFYSIKLISFKMCLIFKEPLILLLFDVDFYNILTFCHRQFDRQSALNRIIFIHRPFLCYSVGFLEKEFVIFSLFSNNLVYFPSILLPNKFYYYRIFERSTIQFKFIHAFEVVKCHWNVIWY